jgi:hypothetical protein
MATLTWDNVGTREFETGVDRGVLYLASGLGVVWNGLTSVSESSTGQEVTPLYFDGRKYLDFVNPKQYGATIKAFTYPNEFMDYEGFSSFANGIQFDNQTQKLFGLSFRTKIGNDTNENAGYKIHILYDLTAVPSDVEYASINDSSEPIEFEWKVVARPSTVPGYRSTAHFIIDSTKVDETVLTTVEDVLYGTSSTSPQLPSISFLSTLVLDANSLIIVDNGDGSWTATGPDSIVYLTGLNSFEINSPTAVVITTNTFQVSSLI